MVLLDQDEVFLLGFRDHTDKVAVRRTDCEEEASKMQQMLTSELRIQAVPICDPEPGEIVACRLTSDGQYYRARVISHDSSRKKAKLELIDSCQVLVESVECLFDLPNIVLSSFSKSFSSVIQVVSSSA
jgi:hypothetical protein